MKCSIDNIFAPFHTVLMYLCNNFASLLWLWNTCLINSRVACGLQVFIYHALITPIDFSISNDLCGIKHLDYGQNSVEITSLQWSWGGMNTRQEAGPHMRLNHDDGMKWKHFPRYWPFVRGSHRSPVNSPQKGQWRGALVFSLICTLNKRLSKHSWCWWFETPSHSLWRQCNATRLLDTETIVEITWVTIKSTMYDKQVIAIHKVRFHLPVPSWC